MMEQERLVRRDAAGKAHVYGALLPRENVLGILAGGFLNQVFDGELVKYELRAIQSGKHTLGDLEDVEHLTSEAKKSPCGRQGRVRRWAMTVNLDRFVHSLTDLPLFRFATASGRIVRRAPAETAALANSSRAVGCGRSRDARRRRCFRQASHRMAATAARRRDILTSQRLFPLILEKRDAPAGPDLSQLAVQTVSTVVPPASEPFAQRSRLIPG